MRLGRRRNLKDCVRQLNGSSVCLLVCICNLLLARGGRISEAREPRDFCFCSPSSPASLQECSWPGSHVYTRDHTHTHTHTHPHTHTHTPTRVDYTPPCTRDKRAHRVLSFMCQRNKGNLTDIRACCCLRRWHRRNIKSFRRQCNGSSGCILVRICHFLLSRGCGIAKAR